MRKVSSNVVVPQRLPISDPTGGRGDVRQHDLLPSVGCAFAECVDLDAAQASHCCSLQIRLNCRKSAKRFFRRLPSSVTPRPEFQWLSRRGRQDARREVTKTLEIDPLHTIAKPFNERRTKTRTEAMGRGRCRRGPVLIDRDIFDAVQAHRKSRNLKFARHRSPVASPCRPASASAPAATAQ
jgi:hypothetical protein